MVPLYYRFIYPCAIHQQIFNVLCSLSMLSDLIQKALAFLDPWTQRRSETSKRQWVPV